MTRVAALLMAAGNARRMGGPNKLLMQFGGKALLFYGVRALDSANLAARILVTGRDRAEIESHAPDFIRAHNPLFEQGFGTSLAAGFSVLLDDSSIDGALVMLADMPLIMPAHLNQLVDAFQKNGRKTIIRAAFAGRPGNPVIIPKPLFVEMAKLTGDESGQGILKASGLKVQFVDIGPAATADIDTPEALAALDGAQL